MSPVTIAVVRVGVVVHKVPPVAGSGGAGVRPPVKLLVGLPKARVHCVDGDPLAGATRVRVLAVKRQGPFDWFFGGRGGGLMEREKRVRRGEGTAIVSDMALVREGWEEEGE